MSAPFLFCGVIPTCICSKKCLLYKNYLYKKDFENGIEVKTPTIKFGEDDHISKIISWGFYNFKSIHLIIIGIKSD